MADNFDKSLGSISVSISKGSVYESGGLSMFDAALEDALRREEKSISNESIQKGDTLLETYTVEANAISGGMGSVWRVHHQSWNTDLAMKRPQPRFFAEGSKKRKENFIKECEAWINLGLHPNIVSCYYVREIGGVPTIFSEWMNNGSLKDRIRDSSLYIGTEVEQEERLLDLAIQFARGLRYSHENGLIHRDVKPDNLLLTKDWDAKVADFGLAKARDEAISEDGTAHKGGYTPEYCSGEQAAELYTDARTDVYSWALTVLEMYTKGRVWESGPTVSKNREQFINAVKLPLPEGLRGLLYRCFEADADKRPGDFAEIEATLREIYKSETDGEYPRPEPKAAADTADSLNNRALSFLDLGKTAEAEKLWEKALVLAGMHTSSLFNATMLKWRSGGVSDVQAENTLEVHHKNVQTLQSLSALVRVQLERADTDNAKAILAQERAEFGGTADFISLEKLVQSRDNGSIYGKPLFTGTEDQSLGFALYSPDGKRIYASVITYYPASKTTGGSILVYDAQTGNRISDYRVDASSHDTYVTSGCVSIDGKVLFLGTAKSGKVLSVSADTGDVLSEISLPHHTWHSTRSAVNLWLNREQNQLWVDAEHYPNDWEGYASDTIEETVCFAVASGCLDTLPKPPDKPPETPKNLISGGGKSWYTSQPEVNGRTLSCFYSHFDPASCLKIKDAASGRLLRSVYPQETGQGNEASGIYMGDMTRDGKKVLIVTRSKTSQGRNIYSLAEWHIPQDFPAMDGMLCTISSSKALLLLEQEYQRLMRVYSLAVASENIDDAITAMAAIRALPGFREMPEVVRENARLSRVCKKSLLRGCMLEEQYSVDRSFDGDCRVTRINADTGRYALGYADGTVVWGGKGLPAKRLCIREERLVNATHHSRDHFLTDLCFSPDGRYLFIAGLKVYVVDAASGESVCSLKPKHDMNYYKIHDMRNFGFSFEIMPNGKELTVYDRKYLSLYDINSFRLTGTHKVLDKRYMLIGGKEGATLIDVKTGEHLIREMLEPRRKGGWDFRNAFSSDGKYVFQAYRLYPSDNEGKDQTHLCIWEKMNDRYIKTHVKIWDDIWSFGYCISPDGAFFAATCAENSTQLLEFYKTSNPTQAELRLECAGRSEEVLAQSSDGRFLAQLGWDTLRIYALDYEYTFPGFADWDEGARSYLEIFLTLHPRWTDEDFSGLIRELQNRGFGYIRPEGVRAKLLEMKPGKKTGLGGLFKRRG